MTEFSREQLERTIANFEVPAHLREGLVEHVLHGRPVGSFLTACLRGDLLEAVSCAASDVTFADLRAIMKWLYNEAPGGCWGTSAKVLEWAQGESAAADARRGDKVAGRETSAEVASIAADLLNLRPAELDDYYRAKDGKSPADLVAKIRTVAACALGQRE
jgi:hypothetical protein